MADFTPQQKQFITQRAQGCCEYCWSQANFSPDPFSIEHIIPRSKGGIDDLDNLALSCQGCNNRKYTHITAYDPITGDRVPLYHPRHQHWAEHFAWNHDFTQVIGLTPTGRATIDRLKLNREGVVNLRQVLRALKQHPANP